MQGRSKTLQHGPSLTLIINLDSLILGELVSRLSEPTECPPSCPRHPLTATDLILYTPLRSDMGTHLRVGRRSAQREAAVRTLS